VSCGKRRGSGGGRSSGGDSGSGSGSGSGRSRSRSRSSSSSSSSTVLSNSTLPPTLPSAPLPFRILLGVVLALLLGVVYGCFGGRLGGRVGCCFGVISEVPKVPESLYIMRFRHFWDPCSPSPGIPGPPSWAPGDSRESPRFPQSPQASKCAVFIRKCYVFHNSQNRSQGFSEAPPSPPRDLPRDRRGSLGNHNNPQGLPMVAPGIPGDPRKIPKDSPRTPQAAGQQIVALSHTVAY